MKNIFFTCILSAILMLSLTACGQQKVIDEVAKKNVVLSNVAEYEDSILELTGTEIDTEKQIVRIKGTYTNNTDSSYSSLNAFSVYTVQGDEQLDFYTGKNENKNNKKKISSGESIEVEYIYRIENNEDIKVYVCTPDRFRVVLACIKLEMEDSNEKN